MFGTVFRFELAYWFKRPLTLLFFVLFFLMAFFSTASDAFLGIAGGQIHRNAPFVLASAMGILTAIGQVITTAIAGTAVLRDAQLGTEEMLFTTQLTKTGYLLGRFAGAFVIVLVIYFALPIGLLVGTLMPWVPADKLGPVTIAGAFQPFFVIALPNLLFASALLFAIGAFTRKLFAVYITGILLLAAWQVTQQIVGHLDKLTLASLIDPFALTTTNTVIRYWSVAEKNTQLVPFSGVLLQNRLIWIAIALSLFALVLVLFRLRLQHDGRARRKARGAAIAPAGAATPMPVVTLHYNTASWIRAFFAQSRFHFRSIIREAPFLAISVICVINLMVGAWYTAHPDDSAIWPVTSAIAPVVANSVFIFVVLLATLYGAQARLSLTPCDDAEGGTLATIRLPLPAATAR